MTYANIMCVPRTPLCSVLLTHLRPRRNYDVFGASSSPGPNAPLGNLCGNSQLPQYSAQAALSQWTAAGFPKSKLVLGLPLYGYVSQSSKTTLQHIARPPAGLKVQEYREKVLGLPQRGLACPLPSVQEDAAGDSGSEEKPNMLAPSGNHARAGAQGQKKSDGEELKTETAGDLSSFFGQQIAFGQLVSLGALTKTSSGTYVAANGYTEGASRPCLRALTSGKRC